MRIRAAKRVWVALALALAISCVGRDARADDDATTTTSGSPYRLRLSYDFAFLALGAAGSLTGVIGYRPAVCPQPCVPPHNQLGIDDSFVGRRSGGAMAAANVLLITTLAVPVLVDAIDSRLHGLAEDMVVVAESLALSTALTQALKSASARLAPLVYTRYATEGDLASPDAARAFPSGHTAAAFSVATSYAYTFWKRHPRSQWRIVVLVTGETIAAATGVLTMIAGWHYPTDVMAGALTGTAVGVLMPVLHSEW